MISFISVVNNKEEKLMEKLSKLKELLKGYGKVAVAYSGGVDSSFLLKVALDTLGKENVMGITILSSVLLGKN